MGIQPVQGMAVTLKICKHCQQLLLLVARGAAAIFFQAQPRLSRQKSAELWTRFSFNSRAGTGQAFEECSTGPVPPAGPSQAFPPLRRSWEVDLHKPLFSKHAELWTFPGIPLECKQSSDPRQKPADFLSCHKISHVGYQGFDALLKEDFFFFWSH